MAVKKLVENLQHEMSIMNNNIDIIYSMALHHSAGYQ